MSTHKLVLSLIEAAELLGLTRQQLYDLTRKRALVRHAHPVPHLKLGRRLAFRREALEAWILQLEAERRASE